MSGKENGVVFRKRANPEKASEPERIWMSVKEMGDLLGIRKTDRYWLVHKNVFETSTIRGKMWVNIESFEKWYANQVKYRKVTGEEPGLELKEWSLSPRDIAQLLEIPEYRGGFHSRLCTGEGPGFRLTVYRRDFETPAWFQNGVMYQVFPDRFAFTDDGTAEAGIRYHKALGQHPDLHASRREEVRWQPRSFEKDYIPDDFYGGTLRGIREKLPYLKELGISCLYLNPIVEARSNHRYDTSDYLKVDPILGDTEDFRDLCRAAGVYGIRILCDGVFSHSGSDSIYFNRDGHYPGDGACQNQQSPYYSWYDFHHYPDEYRSWWGFEELPEVDENDPSWQDYVVTGKDSVIRQWLRRGASGWRIDVADELPDNVLCLIRQAAREEKRDSVILGEVWEDAVLKESYGSRRKYALGGALDSVMNYPFRTAVLDFLHERMDAFSLASFLTGQQLHYPQPLYVCLMNLLGSHDTERLYTTLATDQPLKDFPREMQRLIERGIPDSAYRRAEKLEKLALTLQFSVPGVPSIYYGDELGMTGVNDPFNRRPMEEAPGFHTQWMLPYLRELSAFRSTHRAFREGDAFFLCPGGKQAVG